MRFRILPYSWESPQTFEHKHDIDQLEFSVGMSLGTWMKQRSNKDRESRQKSVMGAQVIKKNYTETNMISTNFLSCHRIKNYMEQYFPNLSCLYSLLTLLKTWLGYGLEKHKPRVRKKMIFLYEPKNWNCSTSCLLCDAGACEMLGESLR